MEWKWEWFAAGVGGLLALGIVRGLLKLLTPVALVGVLGYGAATLLMRKRNDARQRLPAVAPPRHPATR